MIGVLLFITCIYFLIEFTRYIAFKRKVDLYNKSLVKFESHINDDFIDEVGPILTSIIDKDKHNLFNKCFKGRSYTALTREELRSFLSRNIFDHNISNIVPCGSVKTNDKIDKIIDVLEERLDHKFDVFSTDGKDGGDTSSTNNTQGYFVGGCEPIIAYFKPLPLTCILLVIKLVMQIPLFFKGFRTYHRDNGITFLVRENDKYLINKTMVFIHGLGLGYAPYARLILLFLNYRRVIIVELPNISFGRSVEIYPNSDQIAETVGAFLDETFLDDTEKTKFDLAGHSYGTCVVSYILRHSYGKRVKNKKWVSTLDKVIIMDPICFFETVHQTITTVSYGVANFVTSGKLDLAKGNPSLTDVIKVIKDNFPLFIDRLSHYLLIFSDIETQYVIKRSLLIHEMAFPHRYINDKLIVVVSACDMFMDYRLVIDTLEKANSHVFIIENTHHGDVLFDDPVTQAVGRFVTEAAIL